MYHATNSRKRSSLRASRPVSDAVGALDEGATLFVAAFSAPPFPWPVFFIAPKDFFDTFRDDLVLFPAVLLAMLPLAKKIVLRSASNFRGAAAGQRTPLKTWL
jgi:hypothetical protein